MSKAVIAIPTYRRPRGLSLLLASLAALATGHEISVIVADNDAENRDGLNTVASLSALGYRWPIEAFLVSSRGIAQVRNALVEASLAFAHADYILMLDDDEAVEPGWLDAMIACQRRSGADVVGGRVNRRFEGGKPRWAEGVGLLADKSRPAPQRVDFVDSTANILFVRNFLAGLPRPVFDTAFGLTGGEDKEALMRARRAGARFAWAEDAVVSEEIPASRLTKHWVLRRAYRVGNSDMRVLLRHHRSSLEVIAELLKTVTVLAGAPALLLSAPWNESARVRGRMMIWRAAGKLAAFAGVSYREYHVTHGG